MQDHLSQIGIALALVFGSDIRERLLQRATLGENSVEWPLTGVRATGSELENG